jgi:hypothetical protein
MKTVFLARSAPDSWISRVGVAVAIYFSFAYWEFFSRQAGSEGPSHGDVNLALVGSFHDL